MVVFRDRKAEQRHEDQDQLHDEGFLEVCDAPELPSMGFYSYQRRYYRERPDNISDRPLLPGRILSGRVLSTIQVWHL